MDVTITKQMQDDLSAEFPSREIKWLPKITTKKGPNKTRVNIERNGQRVAGCMAHIDARQVMARLDAVVGSGQWEDAYQAAAIPGGVECALTVMGVTKTDVGTPSDQDPVKGAYSDALKRAAVKFGIGRHLYDIPTQWLPFDGWKITGTPTLQNAPQQKKPTVQNAKAQQPQAKKQPASGNGKKNGPRVTPSMLRELHALGTFIHKKEWDKVRAEQSAAFGKKSSKDWSIKEYYGILDGLKGQKEKIEADEKVNETLFENK